MLKEKSFLLSLLIFLSVLGWAIANTGGQVATRVYVDPAINTANPDETFTVDVKIANVEDLWDYEFRLSWDPALLDVTRVTEGSFLNAEDTYSTFFVKKEDFPSVGNLYVVCTLMGEPASAAASGDGTLATVEFRVLDGGNCTLDLHGTLMHDPRLPPEEHEIPHTTEDGFFKYPISNIRVDPSSIIDPSLIRGDTFNVSIVVTMAVKVYAWSVNMSWDPTVLNVTEIVEGPFLMQNGTTSFAINISQEEGYFYANCTLLGEPPEASVSGNGTLITVTYMVKTKGDTVLDISEATLLDYEGVEVGALIEGGYFSSKSGGEVAIISVSVSPSRVRAGDSVIVSIVAKNEGEITFGRSVDVTIYYNESFLGTVGISDLNPGGEKTLSFSWSTKDLAEGNYTIEVVASQLLGETNTANNRYVYEYLVVMPPEQSFPFMLIITIFVVVILVVFAGFVLLKKRV